MWIMLRMLMPTLAFLIIVPFTETRAASIQDVNTPPVLQTKMVLRDLWVDHIFWIRSYVIATRVDEGHQTEVAEEQVVANARLLADSIGPFYGQPAADQLFELLGGHWGAVMAYNNATLQGTTSGQSDAVGVLNSNARQIAQFLSSANPYLPESAVVGLLITHGAHHAAQIDEIEAGDYAREAATWHAMRNHMLVIADAIGEALAEQFPERFITKDSEE